MELESRAGRPGSLLREPVVGELLDLPWGMNRLLEDAFGPIAAAAGGRWSPPLDICETEDALVLVAELPGVKQGDVQVTVSPRLGRGRPSSAASGSLVPLCATSSCQPPWTPRK